jgi:hypothetical protein
VEFAVKIRLGNDAVQTGPDVEEILYDLSAEVGTYDLRDITPPFTRPVTDLNGNTVGEWSITSE